MSLGGFRPFHEMLSRVPPTIFMSCLLAPATVTVKGIPFPSTRTLLFVPDFTLSVGFD
jgi:hypothetical protein